MSDKPSLSVVPFPTTNINNIPEMLRDMADLFENGAVEGAVCGLENSKTFVWVNLTEEGRLECGALGNCPDSLMAVGILQAAIRKLLDGRIIQ